MIDREDNFNAFLKQKVEESHFEFDEAYWLKAEKMIENSQPKRKPFWLGFGWCVFSIALIGGATALFLNGGIQKATFNAKAPIAEASILRMPTAVPTQGVISTTATANNAVNVASKQVADLTVTPHNSTIAADALPKAKAKGNQQKAMFQKANAQGNSGINKTANGLTASKSTNYDGAFNRVKSLSLPNLPEITLSAIEAEEQAQEETPVITIVEPIIMKSKLHGVKDIDVNVVAACENKYKHNWIFSLLGGVSDSRGFEGNTASNSRIGFGYFGGLKVAYKIDKNWFVAAQPLIYSIGAINTSVQTEKMAYDFGGEADEFIVKNKALLFAELPVSIGYRVQRHQISLGAGLEYLVNVKSDVKEFGTTNYTINQWGYTDGFNRTGAIAMFNYSYNVFNEFWLSMMVQKGFTDMTQANYFTTNSKDKNLNLRIGIQYQFGQQNKKGK